MQMVRSKYCSWTKNYSALMQWSKKMTYYLVYDGIGLTTFLLDIMQLIPLLKQVHIVLVFQHWDLFY